MSDAQQIERLLATWEDRWQQGHSLTAEQLCAEFPELIDTVRDKIQALEIVYAALSPPTRDSDETLEDQVDQAWPQPDGFQCKSFLGQGGAGIVYKAWQSTLSRFVALKLIRDPAVASPNRLQRFRAEAKAAAQLHHPNIVQIYEIGEYRGQPFLALEYLDGGTLAQRVRGVPQQPREAAAFVESLALAVQHAHDRGIVHRDLKPANVLLEDSPSNDLATRPPAIQTLLSSVMPKISDFGLAKFLDEAAPLTYTGDIMGTPSYMAPEQAEGRAGDIGPATDVHALGIILYELLTGRPPFANATTMETLAQLKTREAIPPTRMQPGIPPDLENICLKCLQKEPPTRYGSAQSLADDLRRFVDGKPVSARPISRPQRLWRWCRRNRLVATLAASLSLAIVAGFALVTWKWIESEQSRRQADANFAEIQHVVDDYLVLISEDELLNEPAMQPLRERLLTTALVYYQEFLQDHASDPALTSEMIQIRAKVGKLKATLGSHDEAKQDLQAALAAQRELLRTRPRRAAYVATLTEIQNDLGLIFFGLGQLDQAESLLQDAVHLGKKIVDDSSLSAEQRSHYAASHHNLAAVFGHQGQVDLAARSYQSAVDVATQLLADFPGSDQTRQQLARSYNRLGLQQMELGDHAQAEQSLLASAEIHRKLVQANPQSINYRSSSSEAYNSLGRLLSRQRKWQDAIEAFRHAVSIDRQLSEDNPRVIRFQSALLGRLINLGSALRDARSMGEAIECLESALLLANDLFNEDPQAPSRRSSLGLILNNLGALQADLGKQQKAVALYEQAVGHLQALVDEHDETVDYRDRLALSYFNLGRNQQRVGRTSEAIDCLRRAIGHGQRLVATSPNMTKYRHRLASCFNSLGDIQCEMGDYETGRRTLDEATDILKSLAAGEDEALAEFKNDLARTYLIQCSVALDLQDSKLAEDLLSSAQQLLTDLAAHPTMDAEFHAKMANSLMAIGKIQRRIGKTEDALQSYRRGLGLAEPLVDQFPEIVRYHVIVAKICNNTGNLHKDLHQPELATPLLLRAIDILERLNAQSAATQPRKHSLALAYLNLGSLQSDHGDRENAMVSFQKAIELWQSLLAVSELSRARVGLAATYGNAGQICYERNQSEEALAQNNLALEQLEAILIRAPEHSSARNFKKNVLWGRARALNRLKQYRQAAADWQVVLELTPPASQQLFQMERAWSLAMAGDHRAAASMADELAVKNASQAEILYNCSRLFSLAMAAAERDQLSDQDRHDHLTRYEDRAMELLNQVRELKHFTQAKMIDDLTTNRDFQALRSREGFPPFLRSLRKTPN